MMKSLIFNLILLELKKILQGWPKFWESGLLATTHVKINVYEKETTFIPQPTLTSPKQSWLFHNLTSPRIRVCL